MRLGAQLRKLPLNGVWRRYGLRWRTALLSLHIQEHQS